MRIIIAGGRDLKDYILLSSNVYKIIEDFLKQGIKEFEIVSGKAKGADKLGEDFAKDNDIPIKEFPADWDDLDVIPCKIKYNKYNKPYNALAGHIRNEKMALYAKEDNGVLIAFWDSKSTGTKNMIDAANKYGLKVFVINY